MKSAAAPVTPAHTDTHALMLMHNALLGLCAAWPTLPNAAAELARTLSGCSSGGRAWKRRQRQQRRVAIPYRRPSSALLHPPSPELSSRTQQPPHLHPQPARCCTNTLYMHWIAKPPPNSNSNITTIKPLDICTFPLVSLRLLLLNCPAIMYNARHPQRASPHVM